MTKIPVTELPVIGWREWLSLPELNIEQIKVKVDSGARTSSLHAFNMRFFKKGDKSIVKFKVHPNQKDHKTTVDCSAQVIARRRIKSSNGIIEERPIIRTLVKLMGESYKIELSLTSRDEMGFRMLLGREATKNRFNIATGASFLDGNLKPKGKRKKAKKAKKLKKIKSKDSKPGETK